MVGYSARISLVENSQRLLRRRKIDEIDLGVVGPEKPERGRGQHSRRTGGYHDGARSRAQRRGFDR